MSATSTDLSSIFAKAAGSGTTLRIEAYDGSSAGPPDAPVRVDVRSPRAVAYMATAPGSLGMARAFVSGELDIDGDTYRALSSLASLDMQQLGWIERGRLLRAAGSGLLRLRRPAAEARLRGRRHSRQRDAEAIAHHYDVSNRFYELLLGPTMTYTCAVYRHAGATLEEAQDAKHELVARKLGLRPGMRLLDVGCGWGGMVLHAARHFGVRALGVTLSAEQAGWAQDAIAAAGLSDLAEVRHADYRDVAQEPFDAISSIGLTEHIGRAQLPAYFTSLYERLVPGGRLLNHCITRRTDSEPARERRGFIDRYVFPDGELSGVGHLISVMQEVGFEVRHEENLREHYALTLAAWGENLRRSHDAAVRELGPDRARVWQLYVAGSQLGFERNMVQLHQILGVRLRGHDALMPLRPDWERADDPRPSDGTLSAAPGGAAGPAH